MSFRGRHIRNASGYWGGAVSSDHFRRPRAPAYLLALSFSILEPTLVFLMDLSSNFVFCTFVYCNVNDEQIKYTTLYIDFIAFVRTCP